MKNNRIKKAMACLLCIVVLMSSSCAMAGRVDAQAPLLLEDHAVPTTSEFDITAEETEAEIMLLQEDEPSETEGSKDDSTADDAVSVNEEAAPEENTAPADSEGSQDVENEEVSNEQENVSDNNQSDTTGDTWGDNQEDNSGEPSRSEEHTSELQH